MEASVVVVGSGLAGWVTALLLARQEVDVLLVETGPCEVGLGHVEPGVLEHPQRTRRALGAGRFRELVGFLERNREVAAELGLFERTGLVWTALDAREAAELEEAASCWTELGQRAELDAEDVPIGALRRLTLPDWGRTVPDAGERLRALAEQAGVRILVGGVEVLDTDPPCLQVGRERVQSELLVLTAGLDTARLAPRLEGSLIPFREAVTTFAGEQEPVLGRAGQGWTTWSSRDGRVEISGARWATPHLEVGEREPVADPRVLGRLEAFATDRLGLTGACLEQRAWIAVDTRDHLPLIGPLQGQPRVVVGTGFGPNPASWAFGAAACLVDGLLEGQTTAPEVLQTRRLVSWLR